MPKTKNQRDGGICEITKIIEYQTRGCMTARTGRESDFVAICPDSKPTLVEVKKGCGSLTRLQRETRDNAPASGFDYKIERCGCSKRHR
jgi:hypothetical protein